MVQGLVDGIRKYSSAVGSAGQISDVVSGIEAWNAGFELAKCVQSLHAGDYIGVVIGHVA